jgi:hypothetical protein
MSVLDTPLYQQALHRLQRDATVDPDQNEDSFLGSPPMSEDSELELDTTLPYEAEVDMEEVLVRDFPLPCERSSSSDLPTIADDDDCVITGEGDYDHGDGSVGRIAEIVGSFERAGRNYFRVRWTGWPVPTDVFALDILFNPETKMLAIEYVNRNMAQYQLPGPVRSHWFEMINFTCACATDDDIDRCKYRRRHQ